MPALHERWGCKWQPSSPHNNRQLWSFWSMNYCLFTRYIDRAIVHSARIVCRRVCVYGRRGICGPAAEVRAIVVDHFSALCAIQYNSRWLQKVICQQFQTLKYYILNHYHVLFFFHIYVIMITCYGLTGSVSEWTASKKCHRQRGEKEKCQFILLLDEIGLYSFGRAFFSLFVLSCFNWR